MSTPPRSRPSSLAIVGWLVAAAFGTVLAAWVVLNAGTIWNSFFPPQTHGNNLAEITWTLIPTVIVLFLFVVSWQTLNSVEAVSPDPGLKVRAVAGQFQWSFDYLPTDATGDTKALFTVTAPVGPDGGLVLPAGETTHLFLRSPDVIHAFYVPQFLFKRDVVPHLNGEADNEFDLDIPAGDAGQTYRGQCAELCGVGHRIMVFEVHVLAPADFQAWVAKQQTAASATPPPAPSGAAAGPTIPLVAQNIKFDQSTLTAPAAGFTIHYDNKDAGTPHDFVILDNAGAKVFGSPVVTGPKASDFAVPAIPAGTYKFECSIHPTSMFGTLTVQ